MAHGYQPPKPIVYPVPLRMFRECPRAKMARYNATMGTSHPLPRQNAKTWRETLGIRKAVTK